MYSNEFMHRIINQQYILIDINYIFVNYNLLMYVSKNIKIDKLYYKCGHTHRPFCSSKAWAQVPAVKESFFLWKLMSRQCVLGLGVGTKSRFPSPRVHSLSLSNFKNSNPSSSSSFFFLSFLLYLITTF